MCRRSMWDDGGRSVGTSSTTVHTSKPRERSDTEKMSRLRRDVAGTGQGTKGFETQAKRSFRGKRCDPLSVRFSGGRIRQALTVGLESS